ncbi:MAG: HlyD family efflux transporter periplasmic adaptor subunit [Chloroflexi bacterium]|nr:HlyD family efflux transporter periplasmic adaptor subunit [Chloroflexota bacterium]
MKNKLALRLLAIFIVVAVAGVVVYRSLAKTDASVNLTRTATVEVGDVHPAITATGNVSPAAQTLANFQSSGKLIEVNVKAGDVVTAGQKLGKIDPYDLDRAVGQAQQNLETAKIKRQQALGNDDANIQSNQISWDSAGQNLSNAQSNLGSLQSQYPNPGAADQQKIDQAQTQVNQAQVTLQQAQLKLEQAKGGEAYDRQLQNIQVQQAQAVLDDANRNLDFATLTAPAAGTVISVNYSVGDQVPGTSAGSSSAKTASGGSGSSGGSSSSGGASSAFVVIGDPTQIQATLTIDQSDIASVKAGMPVGITADAIRNKTFKGKITSVNPTPTSSQGVTTFTAYASIDNPTPNLLQGMSVTASVDEGARKSVLVVPNMAVRASNGGRVVRKIIGGTPTDVSVVCGASDDQNTEIQSGLTQGDRIVIDVFQSTAGGATQAESRNGGSGFGLGGGMGAAGRSFGGKGGGARGN